MVSGRKKAFDEEVALDAAMAVFWQKGYTGTSLSDLTLAMAINKPSMYRTFGNKEALFLKTTERYVAQYMMTLMALFDQTDLCLNDCIDNYVKAVINMQCHASIGKGCYLVLCQSELTSGELPDEAAQLLNELDQLAHNTLVQKLQSFPSTQTSKLTGQAEHIALNIYTLLKGTSSMARSGFSQRQLEAVAEDLLSGITKRLA